MKKAAPKKAVRRDFILSVRVDADLKAAIEAAAAKDQRSVSQWLAVVARVNLGK
jgi:predicted HicB family RNase H-like nuclease